MHDKERDRSGAHTMFLQTPFLSVQFPTALLDATLDAHIATTLDSPSLFWIASDAAEQFETQQKRDILLDLFVDRKDWVLPPLRPREDGKLSSNSILISSQLLNLTKNNEVHMTFKSKDVYLFSCHSNPLIFLWGKKESAFTLSETLVSDI